MPPAKRPAVALDGVKDYSKPHEGMKDDLFDAT